MYTYEMTLRRIKDGDSLVGDIDLGIDTWKHHQDIRLFAIDTPEIRLVKGDKDLKRYGLTVKKYLEDNLVIGNVYTIKTYKDTRGKFGRILAKIYHKGLSRRCLNEELVIQNMAVPYGGESRAEIHKAHKTNLKQFLKAGGILI